MAKIYILHVVIDSNDADYVAERYEVSYKRLGELLPLFNKLAKHERRYNLGFVDYDFEEGSPALEFTEDERDLLMDYIPAHMGYAHTITKVLYHEKVEEVRII